jgi:hypothetical protein
MIGMKSPRFELLDTYSDFQTYWKQARSKSVDKQIEMWQSSYMSKYPELFDKQVRNYAEADMDWQDIARQVFPHLPERVPLMQKARNNILALGTSVCNEASKKLGLRFDLALVIYVGIGCGAGWSTKYDRRPAVLLGLENIAEEGWHTKKKLKGLLCHEIGHLVHMEWRDEWETFERSEEDPLFRLYSEGFAQRCEHLILEKETWHMAPDEEWLSWCQHNKGWLANEFLQRLERGVTVNDFFGSWFDIKGKSQTGYFLGQSFITYLEKTHGLRVIALFDTKKVRKLALQYLKSIKNAVIE